MPFGRRKCTIVVTFLLVLMFTLNVVFIVDLSVNHQPLQAADGWWNAEGEGEVVGEVREKEGGRRHVGGERSLRRFLSLRVESSQERAAVYSGDDIVYSSSSKDQRGMHVAILNQATGALMAARVFDTYIPGAADTLVTFINSISDERIMCFAILDEGTFSLNDDARSALGAVGSRLAKSLSWRDMWALVVVKGGEGGVVGEDVGKSPNPTTWGNAVNLRVTVPLTDDAVRVCD
ncbi:Protein O-linked-mannose beta-1,2-N-acetylglucosaminyltransferase 1 [Geodia barretti]|uniref:Protein O-linked-mannose beta-1,2-N-acetylglucosaminyltransferase 1 n=1 Tax=Geodia barretti TaxID=519541 RepID=A0AA35XCE7_GEOBA|nr:Protein O-linked-mannose beta-1,2-N-acetylglucosaminyltransferase 1 [Geodia barretti]